MYTKTANMYFVLKPTLQVWQNNLIQAKIEGSPPKTQPHWWDCVPLTSPLQPITFTMKQNVPLLDNLFTGTIFDLYSVELVETLSEAGIRFETFTAKIVNDTAREALGTEYKVFHLLEKHLAVDYELSDIDDSIGETRKLVLTNECLQLKRPFFRIEGIEEIVLIHQELKVLLESRGITGCNYIPVNEYQSGVRFYFNQFDDRGG